MNIGEFVRQFNDATRDQMGQVVPVEITVYEDRSFTFITKTPPRRSCSSRPRDSTRAAASRTARRSAP